MREAVYLHGNHTQMCQFESERDPDYLKVRDTLIYLIGPWKTECA
jgi:hypothetical protein